MTPRRIAQSATAVILAAAGMFGLSSCGAIADKLSPDTWAVTYRVEVTGAQHGQLDDVTYLDAVDRSDAEEQAMGSVPTTTDLEKDDTSVWEAEAMILAEDQSRITATPPEGSVATCWILLDGEREIASAVGEPGQPVVCEAVTPPFAD